MTFRLTAEHICDKCGFTEVSIEESADYWRDYLYSMPDDWDYGYNILDDGGDLGLDSKYWMLCPNCIEEIKNDKEV